MKAGSTPMSAQDLAAISFLALPQGKAEGGKLRTEQLKQYYLSIISRIDEMQEFHDYAEGLQWFMETNPDPEIAIRFGDRGSEYVCLLVPRDAFDAPCKLRIDPRLNGEVDPPNRALRPAVSLFSSLPCVIFLSQLALSGRVPVPAIAVSESSFTQPNSRRYSN